VMHFLQIRQARATPKTALDVLLEPGRRPDLADMELTCENTEVIIPYVDLVNEILEDAVAPLPPFAAADTAGPITPMPGSDRVLDALRTTINQALGIANTPFAISTSATLHSLTDGQPWTTATPAWRIEGDLATYAISTKSATTL